jgi:PUA-domain protein
MKLNSLKIKDAKRELSAYDFEIHKKDKVLLGDKKYIYINSELKFFKYKDKFIPSLKLLLENSSLLKKITIDMGAIKFLIKGADIMRPGITQIDEDIKKGDVVVAIDETNKKSILVGEALFDAAEMQSMSSGKSVINIHYIGDEMWKLPNI